MISPFNLTGILATIYFAVYSIWPTFRFSALDLYDAYVKQVFNTLYTFSPIILYALFDRELPYYYLMASAALYRSKRYCQ